MHVNICLYRSIPLGVIEMCFTHDKYCQVFAVFNNAGFGLFFHSYLKILTKSTGKLHHLLNIP